MNQGDFIEKRRGEWAWMEETIIMGRRDFSVRASKFPSVYRRIIRDLNIARTEDFDPSLIDRLDRMVLEGHGRLYQDRRIRWKVIPDFIAFGFPSAVRREWKLLISFTAAFILVALLSGLLVHKSPWIFAQWFSPDVALNLEEMYDPSSEHYLTPREVTGDADMFGFYIYNNISIAFQTFASGILLGFGSILYLMYNGAFLGATCAYMISLNFTQTFFSFISGHGAVELTAFIFAGAAGWRLGMVLIRPPFRLSRKEGFKVVGKRVLPLICGAAAFLVLAAGIEAFWSSRPFPPAMKYSFGAFMLIVTLVYFIFSGRNSRV